MFKDMDDVVAWHEMRPLEPAQVSPGTTCVSVGVNVVSPEDLEDNDGREYSEAEADDDPRGNAIARVLAGVAAKASTSTPDSPPLTHWELTAAKGWLCSSEEIAPAVIGGLVVATIASKRPISHLAAAWVQDRLVVGNNTSNMPAAGYARPQPLMQVSTLIKGTDTIVHVTLPRKMPPTGH
jgi:hypothetical protein